MYKYTLYSHSSVDTGRPLDSCQTYVMGKLKGRPRWQMSYMKILKLPFSSIVATHVHVQRVFALETPSLGFHCFSRSGPLKLATYHQKEGDDMKNLNSCSYNEMYRKKVLIYRVIASLVWSKIKTHKLVYIINYCEPPIS